MTLNSSREHPAAPPSRGAGRVAAVRQVAGLAMVGSMVFGAGLVSLSLPRILHTDVLVWPINAIVIALTLGADPRRFLPMLAAAWVGDVGASLCVGEAPFVAAVLSLCNMAAVAVSWAGIRRFVGTSDQIFESRGLWRFIVIAGGVAPLVSAVLAGVVLGGLDKARTWTLLGEWVIANGLGAVIFVPILLVAGGARRRLAALPLRPRAALALGGLAVVSVLVFTVDYDYAFLLFPIFLVVVFEGEILGAAAGSLLIMLAGIVAEAIRRSVLGTDPKVSDADMLGAQMFLAAVTLVGLPLATTLEQRRTLRARLSESEENYRGLTEASEDLITRIDLDGAITFASRASTSFGYAPGDLVGRRFEDLVFPEDRARVAAFLEVLQTEHVGEDAAEQIEFRLTDPSGDTRWVEAKAGVIANSHGVAVAVVKVLRDVTRRKIYESELAAARIESEAAARAKAEFLANMSHELRTPLTSVIGFTRLALGERGLSRRAKGFLTKAVNAGSLLLSIINDVLDYSKIESGHFNIEHQPTSVPDLVREVTELFAEPAAEKGLVLSTDVDSPQGAVVQLDQDRIKQVLLNLIANAVKFSGGGEVAIRARWSAADPVLRVEVRDQGPGIAPEDQPRLFTRFSQLNQTSRPSVGGTGLGLAICRGLVEAMGGQIGVVSDLGQGALFWFEVPAASAVDHAPPGEAVPEIDLAGMRILVADDHRENRELVRAILTPFGTQVTEASCGHQAVQIAGTGPFDLILMDLLMPDISGTLAMQRIRSAAGPNQSAPIIAFSAGLETLRAEQISDDGFDDGLSKPILPAALLQLAMRYAPAPVEAV